MGKIITLNENVENDISYIFDKEIVVYEDVQGSKIYVNWDGSNFTIKPKSLSSEPINILDLALQKYYNKCINFLYSFDDRVKALMPKNWYFCFEYFPDNQPGNIEYDRLPKNNLILTGICKGKKFDYKIDELREFANLMEVDYIPVIFKGELNQRQQEAIKYFLNTSKDDLEYVFGEENFAYFFYKLLNPMVDNSFLMNDFNENLEKIIIRIDGKDKSFQILNPLYNRISSTNNTEYANIYSLILMNFLDYCQLLNIQDIKLKGTKRDIIYINFISSIFNMYMDDIMTDIEKFEIVIPKFFNKDKFKINTELIDNKITSVYIESDEKIEYIFKSILGSFNKHLKKPIGLMTDENVLLFNNFVSEINEYINAYLNIYTEQELAKHGLLDFDKYYDIKYDVDGSGDVYPNIVDEFEVPVSSSKKKKDAIVKK